MKAHLTDVGNSRRRTLFPLVAISVSVLLLLADPAIALNPKTATGVKSSVTVGIADAWNLSSNLDPYERPNSGEIPYLVSSLYERLVNIDPAGKLIPMLATSWTPSVDAKEWTFKVRPGVKFHNGSPMTSADIVWSFQQMVNPANKLGITKEFEVFYAPSGVTAVDAKTVKFTLLKPMVDFPLRISYYEAVITPNKSTVESLRTKENGTGPYMLPEWKVGAKTRTLKAFTGYWKKGFPKTSEVVLQEIVDSTARTAALFTGKADLITGVDLATVGALKSNKKAKIVVSPPSISITLEMQVDQAPFNDPNVRSALKKVLDRSYLVNTVMLGYALAGSDQPIPPSSALAWSPTPTQQDIKGAIADLAKSGYSASKPLKIELFAAEIQPGALRIASAFKEAAAQAGVEVSIQQAPLDSYWDVIWMQKTFFMDSWGVRQPAVAFPFAYGCKPTYDPTHWCNPEYEKVMTQLANTTDNTKRAELFKSAGKFVNDDGGAITPLFIKSINATGAKCTGYTPPVPFYQIDFSNLRCMK